MATFSEISGFPELPSNFDQISQARVPTGARSALDRPENRVLRGDANRYIALVIAENEKALQSYEMRLMPEQYSLDRPSRSTVTQTRGGYFIDHFDLGIGTLTLSGTTGWGQMPDNAPTFNPGSDGRVDGFDRWVGLVSFFETFFQYKLTDRENRYKLHFYNFLEQDAFQVWPMGLPQLQRSVREPLLFRYNMQFAVLGALPSLRYFPATATPDDPLGLLATRTDRAQRIAERMRDQLATQLHMAVFITNHQDLTLFDPSLPLSDSLVKELTEVQQDVLTQAFVDSVRQGQAPPDFVLPTDSAVGVIGRTRSLIRRVDDFTHGVTDIVNTTLGEVQAVANGWRDLLDATDYALNLPVVYGREVRETLCSVQSLLIYPQIFRSSAQAAIRAFSDLSLDSGCATTIRR